MATLKDYVAQCLVGYSTAHSGRSMAVKHSEDSGLVARSGHVQHGNLRGFFGYTQKDFRLLARLLSALYCEVGAQLQLALAALETWRCCRGRHVAAGYFPLSGRDSPRRLHRQDEPTGGAVHVSATQGQRRSALTTFSLAVSWSEMLTRRQATGF